MLTFRIAPSVSTAPEPPTTDAILESWEDDCGQLIARMWCVNDMRHFEISDVAVYSQKLTGGNVVGIPRNGAPTSLVRDTFYRAVLPFLLFTNGVETFHASAIVANGYVFAFCAPSGTGKSTLADKLRQRGHALWCDDCLIVAQTAGVMSTLPIPFHIRLAKVSPMWASGYSYLATEEQVPDRFEVINGLSLPLGGLFMLQRNREEQLDIELRRLNSSEAIQLLLSHAYAFSDTPKVRRREMMRQLLDIAASVPIYKLTLPDSTDQLGQVMEQLELLFQTLTPSKE